MNILMKTNEKFGN